MVANLYANPSAGNGLEFHEITATVVKHIGANLFAIRTLSLNAPSENGTRKVTIALIAEYDAITQAARNSLIGSLLILVAVIPFVVAGSMVLSRRITRPIVTLNEAVVQYDADNKVDFNHLAESSIQSHDEAGVLARSFARLHENIENQNALIRNNEERLYRILTNMGDGIVSIDKEGIITYVNSRTEHIFGYSAGELIGQNVTLLMTDENASHHDGYLKAYFESGRSEILGMQRELEAKKKTGELIHIEPVVTRSVFNDETLFTAVIRDITQRKRDEQLLRKYAEELRRSNEELNNFAYVASHDLKAPLRNIWQVTSWIEEDLDNKDALLENLAIVKQRARKMQQLLDDLLEYSRVGRSAKDEREFDSQRVLRNAFELLNGGDNFTLSLEGKFPLLNEHQTMFEMLFRNLFDNAIKHNDKGTGAILVTCSDRGDYTRFAVNDNGPGIEPEYIDKIFEFLRRINTKTEGSGMGLSLVQKILENIGGRIQVESEVGVGTTFIVDWPKALTVQKLVV